MPPLCQPQLLKEVMQIDTTSKSLDKEQREIQCRAGAQQYGYFDGTVFKTFKCPDTSLVFEIAESGIGYIYLSDHSNVSTVPSAALLDGSDRPAPRRGKAGG